VAELGLKSIHPTKPAINKLHSKKKKSYCRDNVENDSNVPKIEIFKK
jgi:hypothetical protein